MCSIVGLSLISNVNVEQHVYKTTYCIDGNFGGLTNLVNDHKFANVSQPKFMH